MLRRLAFGFLGVTAAAVSIAGCASGGATQTLSVGPSFAPGSLYATNSTQNGVSIYTIGAATGSGPAYQISTGGASNGLNGPQYIAFDQNSNLFTTNWVASSKVGGIVEIKAAAQGSVLPFNYANLGAIQPRGIADYQYKLTSGGTTTTTDAMVIAIVDPSQPLSFSSQLDITQAANLLNIETIAGPNTGLDVPSGVAVDKNSNVYVSNYQGKSVEVFSVPTPSPSPSPTSTPSPSPSPTATPTGATATPSPTPVPTATPVNIAPRTTISGTATGLGQPTGIALDASGNIYVADQASLICGGGKTHGAVLIFNSSATANATPSSFICGPLFAPTDVKVDGSGKVYVADSTAAGAGVIYVFAAGTTGVNATPSATYTSPGSVIGLGLTP